MNKLPPGAAQLLQQARQSDQAHRVDLDATLRDLHAVLPFADLGPLSAPEVGAGVDAGSGLGTAPPSVPPPVGVDALTAGTLLGVKAVKVFLATLVLGGAVGGATLLGGPARKADRSPREVPTLMASAPTPAVPTTTPAADDSTSTVASGPPTDQGERAVSKARAPRTVTRAATSAGVRASSAAGVAPAAAATSSASDPAHQPVAQATPRQESELDLIDAALARLRAGAASAALSLLEQHAIRYPRGRFRTEREGLRVLALCDSGRLADGRDAQARFLREAGAAPIATRVRAACAEKGAR